MRFTFILSILISGLMWGCQTPEPFDPVPQKTRAYVHILNAHAGIGAIDLRLTNYGETSIVADEIGFTDAWPRNGYASLLITPSPDSATNLNELKLDILDSQTQSPIIAQKDLELNTDIYTTYCLIDSLGKPIVVRTSDRLDHPTGSNALFRFMNISPNVLSVSLQVKNDTFAIERFNFLNYSGFEEVRSGMTTVYFINDFTNSIIDSISNLNVIPRHAYSFYLVNQNGIPVAGYEILDQ